MRILHIADLHLGKTLGAYDLIPDQRAMLQSILDICRQESVDLLIVAGDLYDRSLPGTDAVALADWFFSTAVLERGLQVALISGNHDSPERLGYCSGVLQARGFHVATRFDPALSPVPLRDQHGPVNIYLLPYTDPSVEPWAREQGIKSHAEFFEVLQQGFRARWQVHSDEVASRKILVAHCFASGGSVSESERPLAMGGSTVVGCDSLQGFDYVALGHLHRSQSPGPGIHYSGSPLAYSASEANSTKHALLVQLDAAGPALVEYLPLEPRHPVKLVRGLFQDLLDGSQPLDFDPATAYTFIRLLDSQPIADCFQRLSGRFPWLVHVAREQSQSVRLPSEAMEERRQLVERAEMPLLEDFFQAMTGSPPTTFQRTVLNELLATIHREGDQP